MHGPAILTNKIVLSKIFPHNQLSSQRDYKLTRFQTHSNMTTPGMKKKKLPSRGANRGIKKSQARISARKPRKSNARSTSTRAGVSRLKGKKNAKSKSPRTTRNAKKLAVKKRVTGKRVVKKQTGRKKILHRRVPKRRAPLRDASGRFRSTKRVSPRARKRVTRPFTLRDETKIITTHGKGREVPLIGEFEILKRTMSFKKAPKATAKLPYQKQIKSEGQKFFAENGEGTYFFKTRISLQLDDGEIVDRWFTPFARRQHNEADKFGKELDDLNLTMQMLAQGYLRDSAENYRLEDIEMEYLDASQINQCSRCKQSGMPKKHKCPHGKKCIVGHSCVETCTP